MNILLTKDSSGTIESSGLGEFHGYAAYYDNVDRNGEVLVRGALAKTIRANDGEFPLLWQHDKAAPIGVVRLEETDRGARAEAYITRGTTLGEQAYALLQPPPGFRRGALRDLSIGYLVKDDKIVNGVRHLKEVELFEVSLVTVAANPRTHVTRVKDTTLGGLEYAEAEDAELAELLAEIRAENAAIRSRATEADEAKDVLEDMRRWRRSRESRGLESLLAEIRGHNARLEREHVARECYA